MIYMNKMMEKMKYYLKWIA